MSVHKVYRSRSAAVRAARNACRRALDSPIYSAYEGPDYIIHPVDDDTLAGGTYEGPSRFELRGPALEAQQKKLNPYAEAVAPYAAAIQMIREAIEEIFGPVANLESKDAVLLRGPEPHHHAEAIIAALMRIKETS